MRKGGRAPYQRRHERGVALVVVLAVVVLMSVLILSLVSLVRLETRSSFAHSDSVEVDVLAELQTNLVISQIRAATDSQGGSRTWASQPGMIRTFGTQTDPETGRAGLERVYRLYSHRHLEEGESFNASEQGPPADWNSQTGRYVDLNEPVVISKTGPKRLRYPILDPDLLDRGIAGIEVESAPGRDDSSPLPMPVEWLYVLADGTLLAPRAGSDTTIRFDGDHLPSRDNPVVGRIAFWADDESSKVNINTASEGTFWDMPRANSHFDADSYSERQPVRNEFQRYPGHPATTSLSPILAPYIGEDPATYFKLAPFVADGGSYSGEMEVDHETPPVSLDSDRLYASVDEYFFSPDTDTSGLRAPNALGLDEAALEEVRFLLTAHSRSPEVNLHDRPRVSLWPTQHDPQDRNAVDRLLAFCATTQGIDGRFPYYFQRLSTHDLDSPLVNYGSSQSSTADMQILRNQLVYQYLNRLTDQSIPGFGSDFREKYPEDKGQILTSMVDYLRSGLNTLAIGLPTDRDARGYSYSPSRRLDESTPQALGSGQIIPLRIADTQGFGRSVSVSEVSLVIYPTAVDRNRPVPERDAETGELVHSLIFDYPGRPKNVAAGYRATEARAFLMLEFFSASPGLPSWNPLVSIKVNGLADFRLGGQSLNLADEATLDLHAPIDSIAAASYVGKGNSNGHMSLYQPFFYLPDPAAPVSDSNRPTLRSFTDLQDLSDPVRGYVWHSATSFPLPPDGDRIELSGENLEISLASLVSGEIYQTIELEFPDAIVPMPYVWVESGKMAETPPGAPWDHETSLLSRASRDPDEWPNYLIRPGDVVRSVEFRSDLEMAGEDLPGGDLRFLAASAEVPAEWFGPGGAPGHYEDPIRRFAMGLRSGDHWQYWGHFRTEPHHQHGNDVLASAPHEIGEGEDREIHHPYWRASSWRTSGSLVEGFAGYSATHLDIGSSPTGRIYRDAHPVVARGLNGAKRRDGRPGDWDQGYGNTEDGAFINKPDESNATQKWWNFGSNYNSGGYYRRGAFAVDLEGRNHSPNRQIASPVMFGSLPTGIRSMRPWETLLFCPNPDGRTTPAGVEPDQNDHIGFSFPRDHLWLDLFWMPVTEPYAISEPFSTAGKVNLNYEIMPFRYIKRRTGIAAVMHSMEMMAVPPIALSREPFGCIKGGRDQAFEREVRYAVNLDPEDGTLRGFEDRFESGDVFRSASEICELFLVPQPLEEAEQPYLGNPNPGYSEMLEWWGENRATGDNVREMPYNHLYPRLTTQSNVYQVHYRVQRVKHAPSDDPEVWNEENAIVLAERRGSTLIERYIDPNEPTMPDFATASLDDEEARLSRYYRFRVIQKRRFLPW
ncbi:MAG: Verru_Chthon cassette protein A [Verrucomicrobiota bacterium]